MKSFLLTLFIFCLQVAFAQHSKIDSLRSVIRETNDAQAYLELALSTLDKDSSYLLLQKALIYVDDKNFELTIYANISEWEFNRGFYSLAQKSAFQGLEIGLAVDDSSKVSKCYKLLGLIAQGTGLYNKAIEYNQKGIAYCGKTNTKSMIPISNNLGLTYLLKGDLFKSIGIFQDNLPKAIETHDSLALAIVHNNLGTAFLKLKNYDSALHHIKKTLQVSTLRKDSIGLMYDNKLMGEYFYERKQLNEAKSHLYRSLTLDNKFGVKEDLWDNVERPNCYQMLEAIYAQEKNADSARYFKDKMLSHYKELLEEQKKHNAGFVFANQEEQLKAIAEKENKIRRGMSQYYGIALVLLLCIIVYFTQTHKDVQRKYTPYVSLVLLVLTFEFLLIIMDPFISKITNDQPLLNFGINVLLAFMLVPLQKLGESVFTKFGLDIKLKRLEN